VIDDIEDVMQRVHDAPDLDARAAILHLDVAAVRGASRRFIASTWTAGILTALLFAVVPTARFFSLVAGHEVERWEMQWIGALILGVVGTFAAFALARVGLAITHVVLARLLPDRRTARFVVADLVAAILIPSVAALPWLWAGSSPLFAYGTMAGAALAAMPRPRDYDFVGALKSNKPRIGAAIARQQALGAPVTLVNGRSGWLTVQVVGNIIAAPFALMLIFKLPWTVPLVMLAFFAQRIGALVLELRGRFYAAVMVQLGVDVAICVVSLAAAGSVFWPHVVWVAPAVPA
jgi:hypothetical protein